MRSTRLLRNLVIVIVVLGGVAYGAAHVGRWLVVSVDVPSPEVILVPASHEWERLPAAARLARQYPQARVVLTQPGTVNDVTCYRCGERPAQLMALGVEADRIRIMPIPSNNTYQEAESARDYCLAAGLTRIMVVTSPYHARRALASFRRVFQNDRVLTGVAPALGESGARPDAWWRSTTERTYVTYEIAALLTYAFRYSIPVTRLPPNRP